MIITKNRFDKIIERKAKKTYKKRIDKLLCRPLVVKVGEGGKMAKTRTKYRFSRGELMEKDISNFNIGDEIEVGVGARYKVVVVEKRVRTGTITPLTNRAGKCNIPEYIKDFIHGFKG